jgi:DNA processing protein
VTLEPRSLAAAALVAHGEVTPARLGRLLAAYGDPRDALAAVGGDDLLERVARTCARRATRVWVDGAADYPIRDALPDRPPVLLGEGDAGDAFDRPRVAIVGTRGATPQGLADARELGAFLAAEGVTVVSGLAIGIDAAAHEGALAAGGPVVGVVATGLDVVYPRRHARLYERVRERGLVVSEHWYGVPPRPERFPVRNRIIAALADAVVVVEARLTGGTRSTTEYADAYGRTVLAVPGSRRNPAAAGCNALIADGALVVLEPGDVLCAIGRGRADGGGWHARPRPDDPDEASVLAAFGTDPASTDQLVGRTGLPAGRVAGALRRLERAGAVSWSRGRWWPL